MITGLNGVSIWGEEKDRLVSFYRDLLQLPVMGDFEGFAVLGSPGETILVGAHSEVRGQNADRARHMVGLRSDNIEADFTRLRDAGVEVIEPPSLQGPNLMVATLADPDGNIFQLLQPTT